MFSIFKKKLVPRPDFSALHTDMHSHILPGIDDGSPDLDTSLELVKGLSDLGFKKFIATPHILWDMYRNNAGTIDDARIILEGGFNDAGLEIPLSAAAEYYMDDHFDELLHSNIPLLTIKKNLVLVEFSFVSPPINLKEKLFDLQIRGYKPVLAHPERYLYFAANKKFYDELKELGCYFQINLLSLAGYYGKGPFELAQHLCKNNSVHLLGTDLHHNRHLHALRTSPNLMDHVNALLDSGNIINATL